MFTCSLFSNCSLGLKWQFAFKKRFSEWKADEIVYLDISRDDSYGLDGNKNIIGSSSSNSEVVQNSKKNIIDIISDLSRICRVPLSVGGKIRTLEDIKKRLKAGADKVVINSVAIDNPEFMHSDPNKIRFLILMEDWEPGQMVQFGNKIYTQWRAGTAITWEWSTLPHATWNGSWSKRGALQLTGAASPVTWDIVRNGSIDKIYTV